MQYPYLTLLEIVTIFLTLFLGVIIFYFFVRKRQETKFLTAIKTMSLYWLASIILYLIIPTLLSKISQNNIFKILNLFIFGAILFFVFHFISKKFFLTSWKKSLITFLLLVVIIFPVLSFFRTMLVQKISNFSVFAKESAKMEAEMKAYFDEYGFGGFLYAPLVPPPPEPLAFKITGAIEKATLSWPGDRIREILIAVQMR